MYFGVVTGTGHVARMGEKRNAYTILGGKSEGILGDMGKRMIILKRSSKLRNIGNVDCNRQSHFIDGILLKLECTFGFHNGLGICWQAVLLSACQQDLCFMEFVHSNSLGVF
jgi:hypothetical protein